ncbi:MAG TPA: acetate/propionate family kinase [Planctomycetaceae bacterium]|nr:acetate/propionate family kinase [Planctomycetaceae bacterium]
MTKSILTINGGSSSIKFALYGAGSPPQPKLAGKIERIGQSDARLSIKSDGGRDPDSQAIDAPDHQRAVGKLIGRLTKRGDLASVAAIGHRIVHGGPSHSESCLVTRELIEDLKRLSSLDPAHLPAEIALIEACLAQFPKVPNVACFDTAFHHDLPQCARLLPIPRRYESQGVRRYGFHGLSYAFLMQELTRLAGAEAAQGRLILAHLGAGASLAAVRDGKCIDTSMSFTPSAGLVMGTRSGDLDPGFLTYLMRNEGLNADQLDDLVNRRSGLLGISETSSDMRDLIAREAADPRAADAVAIFCYQAKKWIGAFAAALGGLDTLVFSGGIGENAPLVRSRICQGLEFLGVRLDENCNRANADVISANAARPTVRVIRTDEEAIIVREVQRIANQAFQGDTNTFDAAGAKK